MPSPPSPSMPGMPSPPSANPSPSPSTPSSPSSSQSDSGSPSSSSSSSDSRPSGSSSSQGGDSSKRSGVFLPNSLPQIPGLPQIPDDMRTSGQENEGDPSSDNQSGQLPSEGLRTAGTGDEDGDGDLQEQRSGDEANNGSEVGAEPGQDQGGIPSSGIGDESQGGQESEGESDEDGGLLGSEEGSEDAGWDVNDALPAEDEGPPSKSGGTDTDESVISIEPIWAVSNELPEPTKRRQDNSGSSSAESKQSREQSGSSDDKELEATLASIDGTIQSDRETHAEKINEQAGGIALPGGAGTSESGDRSGDQENETPSGVGGTSPHAIPNVNHPERKSDVEPTEPLPHQGAIAASDIPDAKDDDVVARQLREAALAEEDPVLREKLWDELRRYLAKRK